MSPHSRPTDRSTLAAWARLVRLPAVFTVIAQVAAAYLYVAGEAQPMARFIMVILAAVALYWSGMIINDLWDIDEDKLDRPSRPLPSGEVSLRAANFAATGLMIGGVVLATLSGFIPGVNVGSTFCPGIVAVAIAVCVLLYNGPLKPTLLAPLMMGLCRALCLLLGAAPLMTVGPGNLGDVASWFAPHILAAAVGMGVYIMGITLISTSETVGGEKAPIAIGTMIAALGAFCLAMAPRLAPAGTVWQVALGDRFVLLVGLIAFSIVFRGVRVALHPAVPAIQSLVKIGVLTLIPFSASLALIAAGPIWGLAVFGLVIPALLTAAKIRVT